ncbi:uncharacterized protein LOC122442515 [Cervus canadensis]|uniref:uncharacterized protein LOC122442515 n=1 Tax=Cervus canadensis TaxID=1574408 RepID=UPI001C9E945E|nr:uncharacterized protein LOC122442515 [Cervus canadensis]
MKRSLVHLSSRHRSSRAKPARAKVLTDKCLQQHFSHSPAAPRCYPPAPLLPPQASPPARIHRTHSPTLKPESSFPRQQRLRPEGPLGVPEGHPETVFLSHCPRDWDDRPRNSLKSHLSCPTFGTRACSLCEFSTSEWQTGCEVVVQLICRSTQRRDPAWIIRDRILCLPVIYHNREYLPDGDLQEHRYLTMTGPPEQRHQEVCNN